MNNNPDFILDTPENIDTKCLKSILNDKIANKSKGFTPFYTKEMLYEVYYLWKKYDFLILELITYIKDKYDRKVDSKYLKRKLVSFEKNNILNKDGFTKLKNSDWYPNLDKRPIKTDILDEKSVPPVDSVIQEPAAKSEHEKTLPTESKKTPQKRTSSASKKTPKKTPKKPETNCIPKKEPPVTVKKSASAKDKPLKKDNDSQIQDTEEIVPCEIFSIEDTNKRTSAEEAAKKLTYIAKLKEKKMREEPLSDDEEQDLWDAISVNYGSKNKDNEIIVSVE